jgi:hypothetical protein
VKPSLGSALGQCLRGKRSAPRTVASEEGAPTMCIGVVSLQLVTSFTMGRTKVNVNPPEAVPQIAGANTQAQLSLALGATLYRSRSRFHHED